MEFLLLGPLEVRLNGQPVRLAAGRATAVLAALLLRPGELVSADWLIEALWGDTPPQAAASAIQVHVYGLRKALASAGSGRLLQTRRPGYVLEVPPGTRDIDQFRSLVELGRSQLAGSDPRSAAESLGQALSLWRGPALADLTDFAFTAADRARLAGERLAAEEDLVDADLQLGRHVQVTERIDALVGAEPFRERRQRQRILALYRSGRQADALAAFRAVRDLLVEELGVDPSPELAALETAILAQDVALQAPAQLIAVPSMVSSAVPPARRPQPVPRPLTPLVGREREADDLVGKLAGGARLLTLSGPGGAGKTRLAIEVAMRAAESFSGGVFFVPLAGVVDSALVAATIADVIGVVPDPTEDAMDAVRRALGESRSLLVLDNFEQLVAAGPAIAQLLSAASGLSVLVTSRIALRVGGEFERPMLGLPVPAESAEPNEVASATSVRLFCQRAEDAGRPVDGSELAVVAQICRRLDGLPLAFELAAARVTTLRPAAILGLLSRPLDVLTRGPRDAPARHQTLRAAIDWSYQLLPGPARELFRHAATFVGGLPLDALPALHLSTGDDVLDVLTDLVDASLMVRDADATQPRFRMLDTIREYAVQQRDEAGERQHASDVQASWVLELAAAGKNNNQVEAHARFAIEIDNVRAALAWFRDCGRVAEMISLATDLEDFWITSGHLDEGRRWLVSALDIGVGDHPAQVSAAKMAGNLAVHQQDYAGAARYAQQMLAIAERTGDRESHIRALCLISMSARAGGALVEAAAAAEQAISEARGTEHLRALCNAINELGMVAMLGGDPPRISGQ